MQQDDARRIRELELELERLRAARRSAKDDGTLSETTSSESSFVAHEEEEAGVESAPGRSWIRGRSPAQIALFAVLGVALVALFVWIALMTTSRGSNAAAKHLTSAYESCGEPAGIELRDHGKTLVFDHKGEDDDFGASVDDIVCILVLLDMPSSITSHMDQTTSMDGRQAEQWDSYEVQWSYHPSRGLDGLVKVLPDK